MKIYTLDDVVQLVDKYSDDINLGTSDHGPDDIVIEKAENALGLQFTSSYKSFLKSYGGGDIGGEEIFSLYENSVGIPAGDIVYYNLQDRKHGFATPEQLVVSRTDFGETFYFDYTQFRDGECPLYLKFPPRDPQYYASNFYEFLCKKIKDNLGYDS
ncbi:SMI1/KNR4 family protein [Bartonella harrusi]|uniref:SMI1/KNR4 family protein n=1 Tax=Bartonella harrusi TaxID=2961895 RepID=A0ABY5EWF3_9HYPH|nr:SMI1/KNR4 family protein [Bartonella harrusi]UTO29151.1 SMI1/KNR4 family protein [Bartonella harrusi]